MKIIKFLNIFFGINFIFSVNLFCMNFFLQAPDRLDKQERIKTTSMCWGSKSDKNVEFLFNYDERTGVNINVSLDKFPEFFNDEQRQLFKELKDKSGKTYFVYSYGKVPDWANKIEEENAPQSYFVEERLYLKNKEVAEISLDSLVEYIAKKNVIFYTGAGISVASKVFAMDQLEKELGFVGEKRIDKVKNLLVCVAKDIKEVAKTFEKFCNAMFNSEPTKAHKSLLEIANYKKCKIVTENLDFLHQKTGIEPYKIFGPAFNKEVKNEWAKEIDAIICCGLSHDDRGFLGWYKKYNSNGVIIALDLSKPNYLGTGDFLLEGDLQEVIPEICFAVKKL